jgi:hypothetical protein
MGYQNGRQVKIGDTMEYVTQVHGVASSFEGFVRIGFVFDAADIGAIANSSAFDPLPTYAPKAN